MITIHSESLDELNSVYRRLKGNFKATETIKLDQLSMSYRLDLEPFKPSPIIKNLIDKVVDFSDEILDLESISHLNFEKFLNNHSDKYIFVKQLKEAYTSQEANSQFVALQYLSEELNIPIVQQVPSTDIESKSA